MTSHEILKADVLDILFDNRNKMYGAYVLRKNYNHRLMVALSAMLGVVLLSIFFLKSFKESSADNFITEKHDTVTVSVLPEVQEPELPEPEPQRPAQNVRQENFVNNIQIVSDDVEPDMPTMDDLTDAAISTTDVEGTPLLDAKQPPVTNVTSTPVEEPEVEKTVFDPIEKNAEYPGGQVAWIEFLQRHLRTPGELEAGQKKTVQVRFAVAADGSISQFEVVQSGGEAFDREVIRVLKKMPKWSPAIQNGHHVSVMFTQPVTFMAVEE